ncbi:MAG: radical SAM protein [Syntrophaceae bacterium]|nr:radical SAM protein [Syntrophaceae bacterium]
MTRCRLCNLASNLISREINVCANCLKTRPDEALPLAMEAHRKSRAAYHLPEAPPKDDGGIPCNLCVNECRIPEGGLGYCGLRENRAGKITGVSAEEGKLSWYFDPLPTNCVADWVCAGGIGAGFPKYAHCEGPERGFKNLAVFFHACTFNCLYCQNWNFREETLKPRMTAVSRLVSDVDERTSCICYFGGDPAAQLPFSLTASRKALARKRKEILRICWETNGSMHPNLLEEMIEIALGSGGCIKFDLKAWDENLHRALTGITNRRTLENFRRAGERIPNRPVPPLVIASTLLVPGYVEEEEVRSIARFIAAINPEIPYSLLAFYPHFFMSDLPLIHKAAAQESLKVAQKEGVRNARIGNIHLLR